MSHILDDLKSFLDRSPTAWHAVQQLGNRLAVQDFSPLDEGEKWKLEAGQKYFVIRGGSLCAFSLPKKVPSKVVVLASHTDSPALKIKPQAEFKKENMTMIGVEVYGSPLLTSWLNRDLVIAGRVSVADAQHKIEDRLVMIDDALLVIPQLAIHLDREVNEKGLLINKQEHLNAILSIEENATSLKGALEILLRRHLSFHTLLAFDLFLVPFEKSRFIGAQNEMIASTRLDNLASAHACAAAIARAEKPKAHLLQMALFWDHEEIGSRSTEGAYSTFFSDVLTRIRSFYKMDEEELLCMKNRSLCLSVDVTHALNPNYEKRYEPHHKPLLGKGIVLKYNADLRYASSAPTAAFIANLCHKINLPYQSYVTRSDVLCGTTVGPIFGHTTGIPVVDLGCPLLSMHSAREVIAAADFVDLCQLLTHALQGE
jgi:aspartyl aminopeptidase